MRILKAIVFGGVGLVALGVVAFFVLGIVSQGGEAPGLVDGRLSPCPDSPNCVSSEQSAAAQAATMPLPLEVWEELPKTLAGQGGRVTTQSEDYISAEFKSAIFGFVDDVEFRRGEKVVHVRSASRIGYSDAGANAARVAQIRATLLGILSE